MDDKHHYINHREKNIVTTVIVRDNKKAKALKRMLKKGKEKDNAKV